MCARGRVDQVSAIHVRRLIVVCEAAEPCNPRRIVEQLLRIWQARTAQEMEHVHIRAGETGKPAARPLLADRPSRTAGTRLSAPPP